MENTREIYDEQYYLGLPVDSRRISTLLKHLEFNGDERVCEIGCAAGHFLQAISSRIKSGIGIDTSAEAIRAARLLEKKENIRNIEFHAISAEDFASTDQSGKFDYVFLMDVTEHLDDATLGHVLVAAGKLLAPNGHLIIHTPNLSYWLELLKDKGYIKQLEGHIGVRNLGQYTDMLRETGFEIDEYFGLPHYRQPLRAIDLVLCRLPLIGKYFISRLFLRVRKRTFPIE